MDARDFSREESPERCFGLDAAPEFGGRLGASNVGFQLLVKMGWDCRRGLGKHAQGRIDPVTGIKHGSRLGLGQFEEDERVSSEATSSRRKLEAELQNEESEERVLWREHKISQDKIREELNIAELKQLYCELCDKQYVKSMDFERHLSSYDHNHKKVGLFLDCFSDFSCRDSKRWLWVLGSQELLLCLLQKKTKASLDECKLQKQRRKKEFLFTMFLYLKEPSLLERSSSHSKLDDINVLLDSGGNFIPQQPSSSRESSKCNRGAAAACGLDLGYMSRASITAVAR